MNSRLPRNRTQVWQFEAIGTQWWVTADLTLALKNQLSARIEEFDKTYSRFRADSVVAQMAKKAGTYNMPPDGYRLLDFYKQLYDYTGSRVTPLIGATLEQAGYDSSYSLKPSELTHPPQWDDVIAYSPASLTLKRPALLDFGAAGKGYLVDIIGALLEEHGVEHFVINAGGDILCRGKPHTILLEDPLDTTLAIGQVELQDAALCGSSGNRRQWAEYTHIIDPVTLTSPKTTQAVWVRAQSCMLADGLSTALSFVSPEQLRAHFDFGYAIIQDGNLTYSDELKAEIFYA